MLLADGCFATVHFENNECTLGGIQQLLGQNFSIFLHPPPPPLRGQFLYPERGTKTDT